MNKSVLVVDDEEDIRAIAQLGLEMGGGWTVFTASSGREALKMAADRQPDVILLDLMMPDMDGRETLQKLKANSLTQNIPVILLTAKIQKSDRDSFGDLDVAAVFAKPFRPMQLPEQISEILTQH
jgi:CheY-like chemotaxis protein